MYWKSPKVHANYEKTSPKFVFAEINLVNVLNRDAVQAL